MPSGYAGGLGVSEAYALTHSNALQQGYMLGLNTTNATPSLSISAFSINGTNLSVTVQLNTNGAPASTTINGTLWVYATSNLTTGFTGAYTADLPGAAFTNNGQYIVTFPNAGSNQFYTAWITLP